MNGLFLLRSVAYLANRKDWLVCKHDSRHFVPFIAVPFAPRTVPNTQRVLTIKNYFLNDRLSRQMDKQIIFPRHLRLWGLSIVVNTPHRGLLGV